jgi:hypothetical protein
MRTTCCTMHCAVASDSDATSSIDIKMTVNYRYSPLTIRRVTLHGGESHIYYTNTILTLARSRSLSAPLLLRFFSQTLCTYSNIHSNIQNNCIDQFAENTAHDTANAAIQQLCCILLYAEYRKLNHQLYSCIVRHAPYCTNVVKSVIAEVMRTVMLQQSCRVQTCLHAPGCVQSALHCCSGLAQ